MSWDGIERRSLPPEKILEIARGGERPAWDGRRIVIAVLGAGVLIFQAAALLGHSTLSDRQNDEMERSEQFRRTVSCFLVEITQPDPDRDRVDVLTRCGLIGAVPQPPEE
jgi:hypothetical protein